MLLNKKSQILENWFQFQLEHSSLREDLISNDELRRQSEDVLNSVLKIITTDNYSVESKDFESVQDLLSEISISRARQGFSAKETGVFILSLKKALTIAIQEEYKDDLKKFIDTSFKINDFIDNLCIISFETFIKGREEVILRQINEISDISTPVIRVWDKVLAMPIIGTLDSARTQVVMESLLQEIVTTGSSIAILDISGVPTVDSLVAQHLIKTVSATRLMGAECIISGIRAEIAQTIVHLGIDLSSIKTKATLASALSLAFQMLNVEVIKADKKVGFTLDQK